MQSSVNPNSDRRSLRVAASWPHRYHFTVVAGPLPFVAGAGARETKTKARSAAMQADGPASPGIPVGLDVMTPGRFKTGAFKLAALAAALALPLLDDARLVQHVVSGPVFAREVFKALLLRAQGRNPRKRLQVGDLVLDLATLEAQRGTQVLHLYPACRKLLEVLMRASPAAVTRQQLEFALWGDEPPDGDLLRSHVYELRRSVDGPFARKLVHTLPRVGYRLAVQEAEAIDGL